METDTELELVFGYGSVLCDSSRASTVGACPAASATLLPCFGHSRAWCFRAASGFTALGLHADVSATVPVNGLLFAVSPAALRALDAREAGYSRVAVAAKHLALNPGPQAEALQRRLTASQRAWTYAVKDGAPATVEYPLLQSYLDVVLNGCLSLGGEDFAAQFISSTRDWSAYWLNDVPASRRPWLHRGPHHATVDRLLGAQGGVTQFSERRHPEEFAAAYLSALRGVWGVPKRNPNFVGREEELKQLRLRLSEDSSGGVTQVELVGLGGVGKSQLATEYCWRWAQGSQGGRTSGADAAASYGMVAWIRAETPESIAGDLRRLAADCGIQVRDRPAAEVVEELRARLFRSHALWLLVCDNVERLEDTAAFLPRGGVRGHVLVTTRRVAHPHKAVQLHCFDRADSLAFLQRAAGASGTAADVVAAGALAEHLGGLPLALAMAAAYMRRADVSFGDYLARVQERTALLEREGDGGDEYPLSVASSLSLSLCRLAGESQGARAVLDALAYLAPDGISKPLLLELLRHARSWPPEGGCEPTDAAGTPGAAAAKQRERHSAMPYVGAAAAATAAFLTLALRRGGGRAMLWASAPAAVAALAAVAVTRRRAAQQQSPTWAPSAPAAVPSQPPLPPHLDEGSLEAEADEVWSLLKSFSLLVVREREGALHRLLGLVIRAGHSASRSRACVRACADSLRRLWRFNPADAASWPAAGALVEHVKALGRVASAHGVRVADAGVLLTGAGAFTALALSRFAEARELLEAALACLQRAPGAAAAVAAAVADAQFELARVLRYQGSLSAAEQAARLALDARTAAAPHPAACPRVAAALHELGVLRLRAHDVPAGESLLRLALATKRAAGCPRGDEASTLHHLAAAAMNGRPPKLDAAEALLLEALEAGGAAARQGGAGASAAAATLQQLGRLALRRSRLDEADAHLRRAGELARCAYGSARHVNVAAIEHALGQCAAARGDGDAAEAHLQSALLIRREIYAHGTPHLELATTLGALGKLARSRGDLAGAGAHYAVQRDVLRRLAASGPPEQRLGAFHELQASLRWAQNCARDAGDGALAAQLAREAAACKADKADKARTQASTSCDVVLAQGTSPRALTRLPAAALRCRMALRALLKDCQRAGHSVCAPELRRVAAELDARLLDASAGGAQEAAAAAFAQAVHCAAQRLEAAEGENTCEPCVAAALFAACDALREALRGSGMRIDDQRVNE